MNPWRRSCRRGFTLIEIMVAVVILGLLTGAVVLTFAAPVNRARMVEAVEELSYLDASTRQWARQSGRAAELRIGLDDGVLERREGRAGYRQTMFRATIPAPLRIAAVRTADASREDSGEVVLPVSWTGASPSYAVKIAGPEGARWVLVAGLSGEVRTLSDDAQVDSIFAAINPSRRNAD
jgi:prepilin-type N-terminal cleavage/methylation domain-containing protein